ncbi:MAG: hypothetical protein ACI4TH_01825, partial [Candidatus Ornithomonoglobus sp.]
GISVEKTDILTAILSISILAASSAVPALADYTEPDNSYDIEEINLTFDDGEGTNDIDGSKALVIGETMTKLFDTSIDSTKEFYLGFDFRFDTDGGDIEVPKFKSSGAVDKVGPIITTDGTNLRTATSSSAFQTLGAFSVGAWYSAEIEGRTGMGAQYTTFRLYSYDGGEKTLVQETVNFNMRNLSSEGRSFNGMQAMNVTLDNVRLVQEKPDTITVLSDADEMNAGTDIALDYVMTRLDKEFNKYSVTWSVYDADDAQPLADENITITSSGILTAGIKTEAQTVTVRASAGFGDKELYGSKQITINAVDTGNEKFDTIEVEGLAEVKAGTSAEYSFKAYKDGAEITDISEGDVVWGIYDAAGITKNNNINMSVENGVLTLDDSIIPQTITVKALSASGAVMGGAQVVTTWSDAQKEQVLSYSACETELTNTTLVDSWDGSKAYATSDNITFAFGDQTAYAVTDVDIKFDTTDGHGLTLLNNNGSENSNIRVHGGALAQQTSGSSWTTILTADEFDTDAWYHIEFLYLSGSESGYNIYKYDDTGAKTLVKSMPNCNRRNDKTYGKITFTTGLVIDNFKTALASPNEIEVTAPGQYMFAGDTAQFTAVSKRNGHNMTGPALTWSVLDSEGLPIIDGSVTVSENGLVTADSQAPAQTVTVRAASAAGYSGEAEITIQISEIFTITNLGINEAGTAVTKVYADKNFYYNDDVVFIITVKGNDGVLKAVGLISTFGDRLNIGSNELAADMTLPADFNPETDKIEAMVWTTF